MKEVFGRSLAGYSFADLHMHTTGSIDVRRKGGMTPQEAVMSAEESYLSTIAITDHDEIGSAFEGFEFAQKEGLDIEVIPGIEVTTQQGHLIGLGITSPVEKNQSAIESIRAIHHQGGLVIAAHPFYRGLERAIREDVIVEVLQSDDPEIYFDGIEVFNMGLVDVARRKPSFNDTNKQAQSFYLRNQDKMAAVGGSDGHRLTVGRAATAYEGDIFQSIRNKSTRAVELEEDEEFRLLENAVSLFGGDRVFKKNEGLRKYYENAMQGV